MIQDFFNRHALIRAMKIMREPELSFHNQYCSKTNTLWCDLELIDKTSFGFDYTKRLMTVHDVLNENGVIAYPDSYCPKKIKLMDKYRKWFNAEMLRRRAK